MGGRQTLQGVDGEKRGSLAAEAHRQNWPSALGRFYWTGAESHQRDHHIVEGESPLLRDGAEEQALKEAGKNDSFDHNLRTTRKAGQVILSPALQGQSSRLRVGFLPEHAHHRERPCPPSPSSLWDSGHSERAALGSAGLGGGSC